MAHITKWPEWTQMLGLPEDDDDQRGRLMATITEAITPRTIEELISLCRKGEPTERYAALGVLGILAREKDRRFKPGRVASWVRTVRHLARSLYPGDMVGERALAFLRQLDPSAAERVLVNTDLAKVPCSIARQVVLSLGTVGTRRCLERLEALAKGRGRIASDARARLAFSRGLTPREVSVAGAKWRKQKDYQSLERLSPWLSRMYGKPVRSVAKVLGPPTAEDDATWKYVPQRPPSARTIALTLYVDEDGRVQFHRIR